MATGDRVDGARHGNGDEPEETAVNPRQDGPLNGGAEKVIGDAVDGIDAFGDAEAGVEQSAAEATTALEHFENWSPRAGTTVSVVS